MQALWRDSQHDETSVRCIPQAMHCSGRIVAKSSFVLCGALEAEAIFKSRLVSTRWHFREGQEVKKGSTVCTISGNCRSALACERTALNYLSLLSGIATKCTNASKKYGKWRVSATRKTLPGLSDSEKRAVLIGGCLTHRMALSDGILVKDNHISALMKGRGIIREAAIRSAAGSFEDGPVRGDRSLNASRSGCRGRIQGRCAAGGQCFAARAQEIAKAAKKINRKIIIEASGGITLKNAGKYLGAGASYVSTSELTMGIEPADLSLEIDSR